MRPRTFILLILVLLVAVAALVLFFLLRSDGGLADLLPGGEAEQPTPAEQEPGQPTPTPTPATQFASVVVATIDIPIGQRIMADMVALEQRPDDNVAVQAQVTFDDPELVVGQIAKTNISRGQEILRPMLALNPSDLVTLGSDLSLYVDEGEVAVAFPITRFTGASYAMRPGDLVDVLMSLTLVELDEEFQTALPNVLQRVDQNALLEGQAFLFPPTTEGRLELLPVINAVAVIGPSAGEEPIPRRVTQLTLQQAEVLWVGSWRDPTAGLEQEFDADAIITAEEAVVEGAEQPVPGPTPTKQRPEDRPDVVILSMTVQDALTLKWAQEVGIEVDLALRAQGDNSVFITTSVSLPQLVEQGGLTIPEPGSFGLEPRIELVPTPGLPDVPAQQQQQPPQTGGPE